MERGRTCAPAGDALRTGGGGREEGDEDRDGRVVIPLGVGRIWHETCAQVAKKRCRVHFVEAIQPGKRKTVALRFYMKIDLVKLDHAFNGKSMSFRETKQKD